MDVKVLIQNDAKENTMSELVSIIVPIYKVEKYLDECVSSLVNQTYSNIEIILVDDGSPDSCPQKCDNWAQKDARIKVIHKVNGGLSDARNAGIDESTGDYMMFVDSDDFVELDMVANLYYCIKKTDADVACCGIYNYINGEKSELYNRQLKENLTVFTSLNRLKALLRTATDCAAWGKLYKRTAIRNSRFVKGRYNEDVLFLFDLYQSCDRIVYIKRPLYNYRITPGSVTNTVSTRTMDCLTNALEMELIAKEKHLPIDKEIIGYKLRICLELGYIIQRANQMRHFPKETKFVKNYLRRNCWRMFFNGNYTWRDYMHAIINLVRL